MTDYPYMYARVSAKKAKLLDSNDYENLLKMEANEISRNLEEGEYKKEIDQLGSRYNGVELVELALNRNLSNTMSHLVEIAPESLQNVLNVYLRRYDVLSMKRLLRWKIGGETEKFEDMLLPVGRYNLEDYRDMSEKTFEEIVDSIKFPDSKIDYQKYLEGKEDIQDIEQALDQAYYDELQALRKKVKTPMFDRFVRDEAIYNNIKIALRMKKYGIDESDIRDRLVDGRKSQLLEKIISARDLDEALEHVRESGMLNGTEMDRLEDIEHALEVDRLQQALKMLHTEPLGITSILGYINAKIIEVKNLRMLIRAKEVGIQNEETIRKNLVMA